MSDAAAPTLLGIDGGGTSTVAWLADAGGRVLGRGRAGPSNAKAVGTVPAFDCVFTARNRLCSHSVRTAPGPSIPCP